VGELTPIPVNLSEHAFGAPQRSGPLTVVPIFGPPAKGRFVSPLSGLKVGGVKGYGHLELHNPSDGGVAIVPLHMGYIQHNAQNHALCRSGFIGAGQKVMFKDACCVQQGQGGYLAEKEQWFFVLPLQLRHDALRLRGTESYGKLWDAITKLNRAFKRDERGHLELIVSRERGYLTQYQSRLELLPGQTGAVILLGDRVAGLEVAPTPEYFAEVWMALACFSYGVPAMYLERVKAWKEPSEPPLKGRSPSELKRELAARRDEFAARVRGVIASTPAEKFKLTEEERYLELRLKTAVGKHFAGQYVEEGGRLVYASITGSAEFLGI